MSAFSNLPLQVVLPLGAYQGETLERDALRADQRCLRAELGAASDKAAVLEAIGCSFGLPAHYGANLDALYDCLLDLNPLADAEQPGFLLVLADLPDGPGFDAAQRDALLQVFRDAAEYFSDRDIAFRVLYSVREAPG